MVILLIIYCSKLNVKLVDSARETVLKFLTSFNFELNLVFEFDFEIETIMIK